MKTFNHWSITALLLGMLLAGFPCLSIAKENPLRDKTSSTATASRNNVAKTSKKKKKAKPTAAHTLAAHETVVGGAGKVKVVRNIPAAAEAVSEERVVVRSQPFRSRKILRAEQPSEIDAPQEVVDFDGDGEEVAGHSHGGGAHSHANCSICSASTHSSLGSHAAGKVRQHSCDGSCDGSHGESCEFGCDRFDEGCGQFPCICGRCGFWAGLIHDATIFGGVHGFRSNVDRGQNGNFGLHEGFNVSGPILPSYNIGYQAGGQVVHSNLSGDPISDTDEVRQQYFFTSGYFRRVTDCSECPLQGGIVVDYLHDDYYVSMDLMQVRTELSAVGPCGNELGFWGAFNIQDDQQAFISNNQLASNEFWRPVDIYAFFWRKRFECVNATTRLFGGFTEGSDGLFGGDYNMILSDRLALNGSFIYINPGNEGGSLNYVQENWGISMNLVWYLGKTANRNSQSPWRSLFNVADNSNFIVRR